MCNRYSGSARTCSIAPRPDKTIQSSAQPPIRMCRRTADGVLGSAAVCLAVRNRSTRAIRAPFHSGILLFWTVFPICRLSTISRIKLAEYFRNVVSEALCFSLSISGNDCSMQTSPLPSLRNAHAKTPRLLGGASSSGDDHSPLRRDQISDRLSSPSISTSDA